MLLSRLAETRLALADTRSRNAKRDLIAAVLRDASRDDVEIVVSYRHRQPAPTAYGGWAGSRCRTYPRLRRRLR